MSEEQTSNTESIGSITGKEETKPTDDSINTDKEAPQAENIIDEKLDEEIEALLKEAEYDEGEDDIKDVKKEDLDKYGL